MTEEEEGEGGRRGGGGDFSGSIFYMIFIVSPSICSLLVSIVLFVTKCFYCTRKGYTEFSHVSLGYRL